MYRPPQPHHPDSELIRWLKEGIMAEKMAVRNYQLLLNAAAAPEEQALITCIHREERRHLLLLMELYAELTGEEYPDKNNAAASMPQNYVPMLKTSICDELDAVAFYEKLAARLSCGRHQELVSVILNDEKQHARALAAIYRRFQGT